MSLPLKLILLLAVIAMAAGCSSPRVGSIVLLPKQHSENTGAVEVTTASTSVIIDQPWQTLEVNKKGDIDSAVTNQQEFEARYGSTLAAMPEQPVSLLIYFLNDEFAIAPESRKVLQSLLQLIAVRRDVRIQITGHTDTMGDENDNDRLALQRAYHIRDLIRERGFPVQSILVTSRGEREPLVKTADEVPEPANRRVEVTVR